MTGRLIDELSDVTLYEISETGDDKLLISFEHEGEEYELDEFEDSGKYALVHISE